MDTVTFELAPSEVRLRAIGVLALSIALVLIAFALVTKEPSTAGHMIAEGLLLIFGAGYVVRLCVVGLTTYLGRPLVKRGLFRSRMLVAWKSHVRAQMFVAFVTGLAIYTALDAPVRACGIVFVLASVVGHLGLYLIKRDRRLAAVQLWATPMAAPEPLKPPVRVVRPMIDSPLPPPPRVTGDPFRAPPSGARLEDKLVKPVFVTSTPDVVASGNVDEPSLLR